MITRIVDYLKNSKFGQSVVYEKEIDSRPAYTEKLDIIESDIIRGALEDIGFESLYTHQAESYQAVKDGKNVVVTTPTASGKTLCYNIPVIEEIYHNRNVRAIYFFPLKALGHDQKRGLDEFLSEIPLGGGIDVVVLDGDTDKKTRRKIQSNPPNIIITNPDILHYALLSGLKGWGEFLKGVKYIVVDELHVYRGIFGSHVYNLFARFLRLFNDVQIISCSATIENPVELAEGIFGRDFVHINKSGAPSGKKHFIMFNPEKSPQGLAGYLVKTNLESGLKTICFTKSRKQTEMIYSRLITRDSGYASQVSSYRAGFLPEERREIERDFAEGRLKAVVSTSAFELGIDIGGVDSTVLVGYPGSMMSLWQRAGRSGRHNNDSLIMMIAGNDALDQYYIKHPEKLFGENFESVPLDKDNEVINEKHVICAAYEKPLSRDEEYYKANAKLVKRLSDKSILFEDIDSGEFVTLMDYPYKNIDLRMAGDSYTIHSGNMIIATASGRRAYMENFKGAVYLHRGSQFVVSRIDRAKKEIQVEPFNGNYFTVPLTDKQTMITEKIEEELEHGYKKLFCSLQVTEKLTGYSKISTRTGEKIQDVDLDEDPVQFVTKGLCLVIPNALRKEIEDDGFNFMGSIHALEHALISMIPTFILSSRDDIGGISYPMHPQIKSPAIFIYDGYPGGIGINKRMYPNMKELIIRTREHVEACDCEVGCPACIYSPKCGSGNYPLDRDGAVFLMKRLIEGGFLFGEDSDKEIKEINNRTDHTLVFDLETKHSADDVGGWKNSDRMGVSVGVLYCMETDEYEVYTEDKVNAMIDRIEGAKAVIGFNHINFDLKVLSGYRKVEPKSTIMFDLLLDVRDVTGKRFSLDNLAGPTLNAQKSADGLQALEWYKEGRIDLITEYCKKDVEVTKDLYLFGRDNGYVIANTRNGSKVKIPVNWPSL